MAVWVHLLKNGINSLNFSCTGLNKKQYTYIIWKVQNWMKKHYVYYIYLKNTCFPRTLALVAYNKMNGKKHWYKIIFHYKISRFLHIYSAVNGIFQIENFNLFCVIVSCHTCFILVSVLLISHNMRRKERFCCLK